MADDVVTLAIATAAAVLSGSPHEDALIRDLAASASDRPDAHACLKRLERTVGKHYCALWTQCRRGCQYADRQHAWRAETDCWLPFSEASLARAGNKAGAAADGDPSPAGMAQLTEALLAAAQAANRAADSA
ncbi:hypothetical protein FNF28_01900 [Cafeteria roenbergensis]|uniref:Uncharacterized protein n=1 Tax=Cafeteria roenbergensis TaxID=33653 RepID=A0A5A8E1G7_CAFRO|nr:hypothetical protein FNF28_01900 [Cafeteria roenbergensis]